MIIYKPPVHTGLDVIYSDEYIIVLNKPSSLLSVPGRGSDKSDCLISRVKQEYSNALIVHRLDMSTSGIIVLALCKESHRLLSEMFASKKIQKKYIAVVDGIVNPNSGEINQAIICDWPNRPKQIIDSVNGKVSITHYRVIDSCNELNTSRVELQPVTGRTHQLRVHMQFIGHAILGDELYGNAEVAKKEDRLLLHATSIAFQHPVTGQEMVFHSQVPF